MAVEVKATAEAAAAEAAAAEQPDEEQYEDDDSLGARFMDWVRTELVWYAGSFTFHLFGLSLLLLIPSAISDSAEDTRSFDEVEGRQAGQRRAAEVRQVRDRRAGRQAADGAGR